MIEFSRIKKITIKEGIVKKITNSSGVVLWKAANDTSGDTSSITVDLNNQWVASTKKLDGYLVLMSNSNKGVANGYASMKIKFKGKPNFKIWINSYAESGYDYTIAFNMDVDYPTSLPDYNSTGVKLHTRYFQKDPTTIDNFKEVDYPNDGGEHFVVVTYRKDNGGDVYDDRGYVAVKLTPLSTSWVLSSTEFIKENDKYYQRINEIGTYEGGLTAPTGNYKKGNELTPTYKQSDANDYIIVGSSIYYKKYAYVTPVDTAINTGDYIQGDYISEITPSMTVVTYTDGTRKIFDINGEITKNKIENISAVTKVDIGNSVTKVESYTFQYCRSLSAVNFSETVTKIGDYSFEGCKKLKDLTFPPSVIDIYSAAFQNCEQLASVTIKNSSNKLDYYWSSFNYISSTAKLYVPSNLLADYQADTAWTGAFPGGIYAIGS